MTTPRFMTQVDYGRHRGVGRSAVSNWKRDELLVFGEDPTDGRLKVDVARTDARLNGRLDPMRGRPSAASSLPAPAAGEESPGLPLLSSPGGQPTGSAGGDSLQSVRIEVLKEQRIGAALKNAQSAGELAPVSELEQRASAIGRAARERMQAWFRSEAERLAAERDIRGIMAIGEAGIDRVFAELADAAEAGEFGEVEDPQLEAEEEAAMTAALAVDADA